MNNRQNSDQNEHTASVGDYLESNADRLLEAIALEELNISSRLEQGRREFGHHRTGKEVFRELLGSIALEEAAIARLIHAEAGKIEAFTGKEGKFPTSPSNQQINDFQNAVARMMESLVEKQKLLIRMIELSTRFIEHDEENNEKT